MKIIENTLKLEIECWTDPGDYPSGAGGGPLASYDFVAGVDGNIVVELGAADWTSINAYADVDMTTTKMVEAWVADSPGIQSDVPGLTVKKWCVEGLKGDRLELSVDEFEADAPEPPEREYSYEDEVERREARDRAVIWEEAD